MDGAETVSISGFACTAEGLAVLRAPALRTIIVERVEQIERHGFTIEHDLGRNPVDLGLAALSYLQTALSQLRGIESRDGGGTLAPSAWPFEDRWWHPGDVHENTAKSAAILWALLDRLQDMPRGDELPL